MSRSALVYATVERQVAEVNSSLRIWTGQRVSTSVALTAPNGYDQSKVDTSISELIGLFDIASGRTRADALDLMSVVDMFCTRAARYTDLLIVDSWFGCRTFADT